MKEKSHDDLIVFLFPKKNLAKVNVGHHLKLRYIPTYKFDKHFPEFLWIAYQQDHYVRSWDRISLSLGRGFSFVIN